MTGGANAVTGSGTVYSYNVAGGYAPNGNLLSSTDSVMGQWSWGYDHMNRLTGGAASSGPYQGHFGCWSFDSFGNRLSQSMSPVECSQSPVPSASATYNPQNQIVSPSVPSGFAFDNAGNESADGQNRYLYDQENRIGAVQNTIPGGATGYLYDAEGNRVAKGNLTSFSCASGNGFSPTAEYLLGPGGEQVTEINPQSGTPWVHSNVYADGKLLSTYDAKGLHYQFTDWLGTRRGQTSAQGLLEETCASLPFGDQQQCNTAVGAPSSADDATEHHFTGKERDTESGLDYFGARYLSSSMGRWMSPDWSPNPVPIPFGDPANPQTLNLYRYAGNNPLSNYDPDGHLDCSGGATQDVACAVTTAAKAVWGWLTSGGGDSSSNNQNATVTTS